MAVPSIVRYAQVITNEVDSTTVSFAATPAVGNLCVVLLSQWHTSGDSDCTVTDNQGNTYTRVGFATVAMRYSGYYMAQAFVAPIGTASGTFTVTVNNDGTAYYTVGLFEIENVTTDTTKTEGVTTQTLALGTNFDLDLPVTTVADCLGMMVVAGGIGSTSADGLTEDANWAQHAGVYNFDNYNYMGLYVLTRAAATQGGNYDFDGSFTDSADAAGVAFFIRGSSGTGQTARPTSDISAGAWTPSDGSDLFAMVDEASPSDTDYITSEATNEDTAVLALGALSTPGAGTVTLSIRGRWVS